MMDQFRLELSSRHNHESVKHSFVVREVTVDSVDHPDHILRRAVEACFGKQVDHVAGVELQMSEDGFEDLFVSDDHLRQHCLRGHEAVEASEGVPVIGGEREESADDGVLCLVESAKVSLVALRQRLVVLGDELAIALCDSLVLSHDILLCDGLLFEVELHRELESRLVGLGPFDLPRVFAEERLHLVYEHRGLKDDVKGSLASALVDHGQSCQGMTKAPVRCAAPGIG